MVAAERRSGVRCSGLPAHHRQPAVWIAWPTPATACSNIYQGATAATLPNRTRILINAVRANNSSITDADLTNTLVAAYCPVVAHQRRPQPSRQARRTDGTSWRARRRWWPRIKVEICTGAAVAPLLPELARLRVEVFREFPYLYDGDTAYEEKYFQIYAETPGAAVVVARDDGRIVGASTCLPMAAEHGPACSNPSSMPASISPESSISANPCSKPPYRGRGIGVCLLPGPRGPGGGL